MRACERKTERERGRITGPRNALPLLGPTTHIVELRCLPQPALRTMQGLSSIHSVRSHAVVELGEKHGFALMLNIPKTVHNGAGTGKKPPYAHPGAARALFLACLLNIQIPPLDIGGECYQAAHRQMPARYVTCVQRLRQRHVLFASKLQFQSDLVTVEVAVQV